MTADERIDKAAIMLRVMIDDCVNCRGSGTVLRQSIRGTRLAECHVCAPLRDVLEVLTQKSPPAGG